MRKKKSFKRIIVIGVALLAFSIFVIINTANHYTQSEYDEVLEIGEPRFYSWLENHPEFKYTRIYKTDAYKYADYLFPYIQCTFYNEDDEWQRLYYDIDKDRVLIELSYKDTPGIIEKYYSEYYENVEEISNYEMYFYRNETIQINNTKHFLFFKWSEPQEKEHEFHNCLLYEDYIEYKNNPKVLFQNAQNEITATIEVQGNLYEHDFKFDDFIYENQGVKSIKAINSKTDEELRVYRHKNEYKVTYKVYQNYNYSPNMQIKYREELYEDLVKEVDSYSLVLDFRENLQDATDLFEVNMSNSGLDISTKISGYYLYFASLKFLEGQSICYNEKYGKNEKITCTFKEVNNGKYPYGVSNEHNYIESFYGDMSFYFNY